MSTTTLNAEWVFTAPGQVDPVHGASITIEGDRIRAVEPAAVASDGRGLAVLPALVDAHDHGRGLRPVAFGARDQVLEAWIPSLRKVPNVDLYTNTVVALGRLALSGVAAVTHVHIPGGEDPIRESETVARAARDVGVRVAYAVPVVDVNPFVYGGGQRFCSCHRPEDWRVVRDWDGRPLGAAQQIEAAAEIDRRCGSDLFTVQYGPAGPQWVSEAGLAEIAERSARESRRVHMHLLESTAQREWADRHYPGGMIRWLDDIGLLSHRLALAHCIWATREEMELLAERGCVAVVNTSSNLRLRSGIAPVRTFADVGLRFAMGLDGLAFNDDEDALFELRLLSTLHAPLGFAGLGLGSGAVWKAAVRIGRFTVDGSDDAGRIAPGADADVMVVRTDGLVSDGVAELCEPFDLLMSRGARRHVKDLFVAGRRVVKDGRLTGIDLPAAEEELIAAARADAGPRLAEAPLMARHLGAVHRYYRAGHHLDGRDERGTEADPC